MYATNYNLKKLELTDITLNIILNVDFILFY